MSGSVWDKYKIPQDPSGNIPEADAVLPQRKPDDLPPAAQEKAEAEAAVRLLTRVCLSLPR